MGWGGDDQVCESRINNGQDRQIFVGTLPCGRVGQSPPPPPSVLAQGSALLSAASWGRQINRVLDLAAAAPALPLGMGILSGRVTS